MEHLRFASPICRIHHISRMMFVKANRHDVETQQAVPFMRRFLKNYAERHLHPGNRCLHLIGLPVTFVLPVYFLLRHEHYPASWALIAFVAGYALQFLGHAIEGNDAGELILIKKWLGHPYVEFGPRHPSRAGRSPGPG